jgi:hypothetical protein
MRLSKVAAACSIAIAAAVTACTPALVPVRVAPADVPANAADVQAVLAGVEKAQLTRGAVAEGALGTTWEIDAREAIAAAAKAAFPHTTGPIVTLTLRDFDVDWTTRQSAGVAEVTLRAVVQFDFAMDDGTERRTGSVVGRGRVVETGWGPKVDQRLGGAIERVVQDAIKAAFADLSTAAF